MTDISKTLGYRGSAVVDGVQVLIGSGGFQTSVTPSYLMPYSIPPTAVGQISRTKVLHADGTESYTASVSFDVTADAMALFTTSRLLQRAYRPAAGTGFTLGIFDGEDGKRMDDCYVQSLNLSGSPGGLISCNLSVTSRQEPVDDDTVDHDYILNTAGNIPQGYWYSGNTDVRDWSFAWNQELTPVWYNDGGTTPQPPRYIKIGMIEAQLDVTTYDQLHQYNNVSIVAKTFTLTGITTSEGHQYGGLTDLGTYQHSFATAADATVGSDDPVLAIA